MLCNSRKLEPGVTDNLEGWDGGGGGRDVHVKGDMGRLMDDSR